MSGMGVPTGLGGVGNVYWMSQYAASSPAYQSVRSQALLDAMAIRQSLQKGWSLNYHMEQLAAAGDEEIKTVLREMREDARKAEAEKMGDFNYAVGVFVDSLIERNYPSWTILAFPFLILFGPFAVCGAMLKRMLREWARQPE